MFGRRFKLFKIQGFQVWADWSWALLAVLLTWSLADTIFPVLVPRQPIIAYWVLGALGAIGLFLSIVIHEFAHSYVAQKRGLPMKGITLFIFGGVAEMADEPPSPGTEFWMAIVGPLTSIGIGLLCLIVAFAFRAGGARAAWAVFSYLGYINLILAGFNLIPAFPLDGGRVLRSVLWHFKGDLRWATRISSAIGSTFGLLLIVFGLINVLVGNPIGGVWYLLIGLFVRQAAATSYQQVLLRQALEGEKVGRFLNPNPTTVAAGLSLRDFVNDVVYRYHHKRYPVVDGSHVLGIVTLDRVRAAPADEWDRKTVGEIADPAGPDNTVSIDADAMRALALMQRSEKTMLLVVDGNEFEGVVTLRDIMELFAIKVEFQDRAAVPASGGHIKLRHP